MEETYCLNEDWKNEIFSTATLRSEDLLEEAESLVNIMIEDIDRKEFKDTQRTSTHGLRLDELEDMQIEINQALDLHYAVENLRNAVSKVPEEKTPLRLCSNLVDCQQNIREFLQDTWDNVFRKFQYIAPHGTSFGAQEGDGACFQFKVEEAEYNG